VLIDCDSPASSPSTQTVRGALQCHWSLAAQSADPVRSKSYIALSQSFAYLYNVSSSVRVFKSSACDCPPIPAKATQDHLRVIALNAAPSNKPRANSGLDFVLWQLHRSYYALRLSAKSDCSLCNFIRIHRLPSLFDFRVLLYRLARPLSSPLLTGYVREFHSLCRVRQESFDASYGR